MKNLFSFFAFFTFLFANSQDKLPVDKDTNKVMFSAVTELDSTYSANNIYSLVKEWFSANDSKFNRSNADKNYETNDLLFGLKKGKSTDVDLLHKIDMPLKLADNEEKKIIGKVVFKYSQGTTGCIRIMYVTYTVKVFIKDYKFKYEITDFNYDHYNQVSMKRSQIYGWNDSGPCSSKNAIETLMTCEKCEAGLNEFYNALNKDVSSFIDDLKTFIRQNKNTLKKSDW